MMDEIINKMDESAQKGFIVKFAKSKGGKISQAWYKSKADAQKALVKLKKDGLNGIITPGNLDDTMDEDAPANAVAHGGVDMNPTGKKVKKKDVGSTDAEDVLRRTILKKFSNSVREGLDNNNVVLRGINETLNKLEDKIDEKNGITKEEIKVVEKKQTFHDKFVKELAGNTPHSGQFDEDL